MFEQQEDVVDRIVRLLRRPISVDPALDGRVMQQIAERRERRGPSAATALWHWLAQPRPVPLSPLAGLAVAAGIALLAVLPNTHWFGGARGGRGFQFVLVAPYAARVTVVGDFNDWDAARTPMRPLRADGTVWTAVVPLAPGRYRYAFLVDGSQWLADPAAPVAFDDEYGTPSSVVTVGGS